MEEGALVLGLPPGSQPPAWEREGGETGQREVRPSGAAQDPVAENGAIREPSGRRNRLEPVGPSEDGVGLPSARDCGAGEQFREVIATVR